MWAEDLPPPVFALLARPVASSTPTKTPVCVRVFQFEEDELRDVPLLVFANKQDLPGAVPAGDITEALRLSGTSRAVGVLLCGSVRGHLVPEGCYKQLCGKSNKKLQYEVPGGPVGEVFTSHMSSFCPDPGQIWYHKVNIISH